MAGKKKYVLKIYCGKIVPITAMRILGKTLREFGIKEIGIAVGKDVIRDGKPLELCCSKLILNKIIKKLEDSELLVTLIEEKKTTNKLNFILIDLLAQYRESKDPQYILAACEFKKTFLKEIDNFETYL